MTKNFEKSLSTSYSTLQLTAASGFAYQVGQTTYSKILSISIPV